MKLKNIFTIIILGMCGGTIYLLPYMKYFFYNQMITSTGFSGEKLGYLVTMYAIACLFLLLPGGILADRLSSRKCILGSLMGTAILTVVYAYTYTSYIASLIVWFLLAFTTIFLAWPAIMKTVRSVGGEQSGTAYSIYYASNGLTGALSGYAAIKVFSNLSMSSHDAFFWGVITTAIANVFTAVLVYLALKNMSESTENEGGKLPTLKDSYAVIKMPIIWLITLVLFCTYSMYVGMTFFTPYLSHSFGLSDETSGTLSLVRSYLFMSLTPITGIIADRYFKSTLKWFRSAYPIVVLCIIGVLLVSADVSQVAFVTTLTMVGAFFVCTLYASMFSILSECKIPMAIAGTAIGLVSIFSYTPDVIIQPLFGYFVDHNDYHSIFFTLIGMGIVCIISCFYLIRMNNKKLDFKTEESALELNLAS